MVDAAIDTFGQLDIAINNAGISHAFELIHTGVFVLGEYFSMASTRR
jgi:NAD(P)-dependent dehydrogenase (short-subunit alcohol dehydrogenase family)